LLLLSSWHDVVFGIVTAIVGILFITAGMIGYFTEDINSWVERVLCILGGILLIVYPHWLGAVIGFIAGLLVLMSPMVKRRVSLKILF